MHSRIVVVAVVLFPATTASAWIVDKRAECVAIYSRSECHMDPSSRYEHLVGDMITEAATSLSDNNLSGLSNNNIISYLSDRVIRWIYNCHD